MLITLELLHSQLEYKAQQSTITVKIIFSKGFCLLCRQSLHMSFFGILNFAIEILNIHVLYYFVGKRAPWRQQFQVHFFVLSFGLVPSIQGDGS